MNIRKENDNFSNLFLKLRKRQTYFYGGYFYMHSHRSKWEWLKKQIMASTSCHSNCAGAKHIPIFLKKEKPYIQYSF